MKIISKNIKNIYLKLFFSGPKLLSTITFIPFLYIFGWILAFPTLLIGLDKESLSLLGTIFTFLIFVISLPKWFYIRWNIKNTWTLLGINTVDKNRKLILYFLRGLIMSSILIFLILITIIGTKSGYWIGEIYPDIFFNGILLMIGVGLAEELIFRGWLLEELKKQFGLKNAIIAQASVFSIVHIGFDLPFWQILSILTGLFLLGILLALIRLKDRSCLWGCIGLHGGLVGLWFLTNNGLLEISEDAPNWLIGPGNLNTNPLGGIFGISLLIIFCFFYLKDFKKTISIFK
ncbi:type II CAAX endopeptidase family protein [Prochlorococcus sp. MIT 0604]|uniref:type II CAAX endopeptidase family protein n=1 Tax=Prochlorococcus sp. MIT 0604 TaxID=1501268 RepID=UPI0004F8E455|nr:type II CAAX endopeptidase family protein [Prochlorococcus sp. MIT 0604]AIQ94430.1 Metal-dependent membrane protease [Prochlorococcus sp. MIT 0604]